MSSQFYHVNAYGRHAGRGKEGGHTIASIIDEAERVPGNYPHIEKPCKPLLLMGCTPKEAGAMATTWAEDSQDSRGHKLRKDGHCLLAGVVSVSDTFSESLWPAYKDQTIKYLSEKHGSRLKSVIEHKDENIRHLHFYVVPNIGERFEDIHEGIKAQNSANPDRGKKNTEKTKVEKQIDRKLSNFAYTAAMRKVQDSFWIKVSSRFGLSRIGPKRKRLTRKEVREQKLREKEITLAYEQVEKLKNELTTDFSEKKTSLINEQETILAKMQDKYLAQQKGLNILQESATQEIQKARHAIEETEKEKKSAKEIANKAAKAKQIFDKGKELLSQKLISYEYDGKNVPKPKFMESAQKYMERVYDDLKWIANRYKEEALEKLPNIMSLQNKLEIEKNENQRIMYEIRELQKQINTFKTISPDELIILARKRQKEIENAAQRSDKQIRM